MYILPRLLSREMLYTDIGYTEAFHTQHYSRIIKTISRMTVHKSMYMTKEMFLARMIITNNQQLLSTWYMGKPEFDILERTRYQSFGSGHQAIPIHIWL